MRDLKPLLFFCAILTIVSAILAFSLLSTLNTLKGVKIETVWVPSDLAVRHDGCGPTWGCSLWYNYYDASGHVIVLQPGEAHRETHERLHAHQHMSINGGAPLAPSDYDLGSWYASSEGQSFMTEVGVPSILWSSGNCPSYQNGIEAFACVGQLWYNDPTTLHDLCLTCYRWAGKNLP